MFHGKRQLTVWLSEEEDEALSVMAQKLRLPRATVVRRLLLPDAATVSRKVKEVPSSFPKADATLEGLPESPTVPPGRGFDLERWKKMSPGKELPK